MKKNIFYILCVSSVILLMTVGTAWSGEWGERRHHRQKERIHQGVRSGELTRHERRMLKQEQRRIREFRREARSDGHVSNRERRKLNRMQDRASRHIYGYKHNDRRRYNHRYNNYTHHYNNRYNYKWGYKPYQWRYHQGYGRPYHGRRYHNGCSTYRGSYNYSGTWYDPGAYFSFSVGGKLD